MIKPTKSVHDFTVKDIDDKTIKLADYKGKVLLIVNTASKCGLTPQYEELQAMYLKYKDQGLEILGFPANNFMYQEPGNNNKIKEFCSINYSITFPMFSKISVKGKDMDPLYKYLTSKKENNVLDAPVSWNFQKFLIDQEGKVVQFFPPTQKVTEVAVISAIEALLNK